MNRGAYRFSIRANVASAYAAIYVVFFVFRIILLALCIVLNVRRNVEILAEISVFKGSRHDMHGFVSFTKNHVFAKISAENSVIQNRRKSKLFLKNNG